MSEKLDMDQIAEGLGARRKGKVRASGGYFGAMQLAADVAARFRVPARGGRATDPNWSERRLIPLSPNTLKRLEEVAGRLKVSPLQVAALLLEKTVDSIRDDDVLRLADESR
jgi:hypothetical protein